MVTLGLDTATEDTAVAIISDERTLFEAIEGPERGRPLHGPALLPLVEQAVDSVGGWRAIDRIAVGRGPGSFTGLRVGLATAQALGRSADIEVVGVSTLDGLAAGAGSAAGETPFIAAIDARRDQVFLAIYAGAEPDSEWQRPISAAGPIVCRPDQLNEVIARAEVESPRVAVGSGALRFPDHFEAAGIVVPGASNPVHSVSGRWIARIGGVAPEPVEPIYLRAPDAQRWLERARSEKDDS